MFDDIVEALIEYMSDDDTFEQVLDVASGQTAQSGEFIMAIDDQFLDQLSDDELTSLVAELDQTGVAPAVTDAGQIQFGMTSSEAIAEDTSDMIESRDGTRYPTVSDFISDTNGYEPIE